jgi:hypothetical protein
VVAVSLKKRFGVTPIASPALEDHRTQNAKARGFGFETLERCLAYCKLPGGIEICSDAASMPTS